MKTKIIPLITIFGLLIVGLLIGTPPAAQALPGPPLDAQLRASLAEKAVMAQRMASDKAAGARQPAPKQPGTPPDFGPQTTNNQTPPTGIFEGGEAIIHGFQATILNHWQGTPDGTLTQVFAGALADDPDQGVIFVAIWAGNVPQITQYLTPSHDGAARITAEQAGSLQVQTSGGSQWSFDWHSGEFK